ncbi:unnamed protein product [Effrenium voratum]|nr:unnamed protein product [Effrenium voratum]
MVCVQSSIELPTPELDFDAQVIEYSLSRTKMQQGALWMEGRSQPFSLAPGGLEGAAGELFVEVKIVDIPTEEDLEEMKAASETASRSSLPSTGTTRSAKVALPPPRRGELCKIALQEIPVQLLLDVLGKGCPCVLLAWGFGALNLPLPVAHARLYYVDFTLSFLATGFTVGLLGGSLGSGGEYYGFHTGFIDEISGANHSADCYLWSMLGGIVWNMANILLCKGIDMMGNAIGFPLCVGLGMVTGAVVAYVQDPKSSLALLVPGVVVALAGISTVGLLSYRKDQAFRRSGSSDSSENESEVEASDDYSLVADDMDAIAKVEASIGAVVQFFGPDGRDRIRQSIDADRQQSQALAQLEDNLRAQNDWESADSIVKLKLDASENSLRQVAPMRRHIRDICDLLMELQDLDVQSDAASLQSIFLEMKDAAAGAADKAERGQQHLIAVSQQIRDIQLTYITRRDRCMSDQKACEDEAENKKIEAQSLKCRAVGQGAGSFACGAAGTGATGVGATVAYLGAQTVASLPYLGPLLTTTGPTGLFTAAVVSFNPVGVGVLVGCSVIFGAFAVKNAIGMVSSIADSRVAKNAAHQKEEQALECRAVADQSDKVGQLAKETKRVAEFHKLMWSGIALAASEASTTFKSLQQTDPNGARRRRFEQKMKEYAEQLVNFLKAVDEYLFFLSKTDAFPPNFDLRVLLGSDRYAQIERDLAAAMPAHVAPSPEMPPQAALPASDAQVALPASDAQAQPA